MSARRAVVVGASMAGLCAARVLRRFYDRVTIVERDALPRTTEDRPGVPQGRHVHALLARGLQELERLFPGFRGRMLERGALDIDVGLDFVFFRPYGWAPRQSAGIRTLFASRRLIESVVRELLLVPGEVEVRDRTTVTGLVTSREDGRLRTTGLAVVPGDGGGSTIEADLVVDASGRESKAPEWLRALGLELPEDTVVDARAGYSTRWYQAPPAEHWPRGWWWKGIWIDPKPPDLLVAGVLFPVEQNRWMVTLGGLSGNYPPADEVGFTAALRNLRSPLLADAVELAEPISPVYGNRQMANRLRHFERWKERLEGFVATGDAVCAFNPIYGQGMTTAAISAGVLARVIEATGPIDRELPRRFFRELAREQRGPWALATGADLRLAETEGHRPFAAEVVGRYVDSLFLALNDDPVLLQRLAEVIHMVRPASALFAPAIVARVAAWGLWRRLRPATARPLSPMPPIEEVSGFETTTA